MGAQWWVPLIAAALALVGVVYTATVTTRGSTRVASEASAERTLDKVFEQRLLFRDEQIAELREELVQQAAAHTQQIDRLSAEVRRLTQLVLELGGDPHGQQ